MSNQEIRCNVDSCRFNSNDRACDLGSIQVGHTTSTPSSSKDTECASFECK